MYFLGYDIGSSSIKVSLVAITTGKSIDVIKEPINEMPIKALKNGWAEQDPDDWWEYACLATKTLLARHTIPSNNIKGIGISYQMHGLVLIDKKGKLLRNSIIWCDSRAVDIGEQAFLELGPQKCTTYLLNSPANFTASKLKWVKEYEPDIYKRIYKAMLPGDYIAYKLSDTVVTTIPGLSEGIFWDYKEHDVARWLLQYYGLVATHLPEIVDTFGHQGQVSKKGASETGLAEGTPILYRAGDQPNNALSLNIFNPGEVAITGGTSGVVYAITETPSVKESKRVNNFVHVNYQAGKPRIGKLLCINGAGIQYSWLLQNLKVNSYDEMNSLATSVSLGSDGVLFLPFGNGAERMLDYKDVGTHISYLNLNNHSIAHLCRAALEGIAFAFVYGMEIMKSDGIHPKVIRAGNDNLFRSAIFSETISTLIGEDIEIYNTTGAIGAARACMLHEGDYKTFGKQILDNDYVRTYRPNKNKKTYTEAYMRWKDKLELLLKN
jgi:xylulokinase